MTTFDAHDGSVAVKAYLYDGSGQDREVEVDAKLVGSLDETQVLWIDICDGSDADYKTVSQALALERQTIDRLTDETREQRLDNYGDYLAFGVRTFVENQRGGGKTEIGPTTTLGLVIGPLWLVTTHKREIAFLKAFQAQDKGETKIGRLPPALLAVALLDWHLGDFFHQVSGIEAEVDDLDQAILAEGTQREVLTRIVAGRTRVSKLRAMIADQRQVFHGLSRPDVVVTAEPDIVQSFKALGDRFDRAVDEVERSRDVVVGSFDLFTSITTQKTNDLVKALTFVTAIIGVCAAVAGVLGMNFELPLYKTGTTGFLIVTGGIALLAAGSIGLAKLRDWI